MRQTFCSDRLKCAVLTTLIAALSLVGPAVAKAQSSALDDLIAAVVHIKTSINPDGVAAIFWTTGNPDCHVILRGSNHGPNHDTGTVTDTLRALARAGLPQRRGWR